MNDVLSLMGGGGQYSGIIQQMLQGLMQKKLAPRSMGANGYQVPQNSDQIGYIDPRGIYHSGMPVG